MHLKSERDDALVAPPPVIRLPVGRVADDLPRAARCVPIPSRPEKWRTDSILKVISSYIRVNPSPYIDVYKHICWELESNDIVSRVTDNFPRAARRVPIPSRPEI